MAQQLTEILNYFLEEYIPRKKELFGKDSAAWKAIHDNAPSKMYETGLLDANKYLVIGSVGRGNWTDVPWLAIFRSSITISAQNGVYIVYLLSSDAHAIYLTFNQGVTDPIKNVNPYLKNVKDDDLKKSKREIIRENVEIVRKEIDKHNFLSDDEIHLADSGLGKQYEKGTIFYKKYVKGALPSEEQLQKDLKEMLEIYEEFYDKFYAEHIPEDTDDSDTPKKEEKEMVAKTMNKIFFGAPGTGKSYKVNSILGEERKKCFAKSSEIVKSNHYADVLSNKEYIDCSIWIIDNIRILEKKLTEFDSDDKRANPRHSALQAYIDFLKNYREENRELRTTFHPDYDYAQFVGAYKPKKVLHCDNGLLSEEQLAQKLSEIFPKNGDEDTIKTASIAQFGLQYANSLDGKIISKIVKLSNIGDENYKSAILSAVVKARQQLPNVENGITYSFVPQVFAKAYAAAWRLQLSGEANKNVFLVIEEINRGNCAQIFGDIFQLLDRDSDGFSQYSIDADCDFAEWLETDEDGLKSIWDKYKEVVGEGKLKLPPNLNILATMNTSDQSLFPMDSAFKRRFDWEYVPINDKHPEAHFAIEVGNIQYDWRDFLKKVNKNIYDVTKSEDKQLGEFFIKPKNGNSIKFDEFRSKVLFYLWDSIYKDEEGNEKAETVFHFKIAEGSDDTMTFQKLFDKENGINYVKMILDRLNIKEYNQNEDVPANNVE